jgi:hypothetical protein
VLAVVLVPPATLSVFVGVEALFFDHIDSSLLWALGPMAASWGVFTIFFDFWEDDESGS